MWLHICCNCTDVVDSSWPDVSGRFPHGEMFSCMFCNTVWCMLYGGVSDCLALSPAHYTGHMQRVCASVYRCLDVLRRPRGAWSPLQSSLFRPMHMKHEDLQHGDTIRLLQISCSDIYYHMFWGKKKSRKKHSCSVIITPKHHHKK